jgi:hypothetical protein
MYRLSEPFICWLSEKIGEATVGNARRAIRGEQEYRLIRQGVPGLCVLREKSIAHLHHP